MLRYRRYRAFLVFAVFAIFGIYYGFSGDGSWQPSSLTAPSLDRFGFSGQRSKSDSPSGAGQTYQPDLGGERKPDPAKSNADGTPLSTVNDDDHDMPRKSGASLDAGDKTGRPNAEMIKPSPQEKEESKAKDRPAARPVSNPLDTNRGGSTGSSKGSSSSQKESSPQKESSSSKDSSSDSSAPPSTPKQDPPKFYPIGSHEGSPKTFPDTVSDAAQDTSAGPVKVLPPTPQGNIHWIRQPEHFPVKSIIPLPSGAAKAIPQVQFDDFPKESKDYKTARLEKLDTIRKVAKKNWDSYKEYAWMHDEFTPVSASYNDPFGGWAATLVDALDTLYIMGLVDEFEEGVEAVGTIDFTASVRDDIPLFETVIRYMGGMLGAYDVSGAKYPVLLNKTIELAEILIGAFDTPNRMPVTYYQWKPAFASQPHRAGSNVVMAELGTLSLEFTRLAQLTKEHKYYDAIDRITDAFVELQTRETEGTTLPGLFPLNIDASGCMKPDPFASAVVPKKQNQRPIKAAEPVIPKTDKKDGTSGKSDAAAAPKADEGDVVPGEKSSVHKPKNGDALSPLKSAKQGPAELDADGFGGSKASVPEKSTGKAAADTDSDSFDTSKASPPIKPIGKAAGESDSDGFDTSKASSPGKSTSKATEDLDSDGFDTSKASSPGRGKNPSIQKRQALPVDEPKADATKADETKAGSKIPKEESPIDLAAAKPDAVKPDNAVPISAAETTTADVSSHNPYADPVAYLPDEVEICAPSNLTSGNKYGRDRYSLSGMADSTYEYFPKTYLLLGGLEEKYRGLHERAMDAATEKLLFRPHVPGAPDILISGDYDAWHMDTYDHSSGVIGEPISETAHLACFAGGMYALGAKIFDRPDDLDIAAKLTEGCVWAYSVTKSGVMPEAYAVMPCKDKDHCEWDSKIYADAIDPQWEFRQHMYENQLQAYNDRLEAEKAGSTVPPYTGEKDAVEHLVDEDEDLKGALLGKSGHNSNAPHPKNPQDISDSVRSPDKQRNPQKIGDDGDSPTPQRNPQKITDEAEARRLVKRVYDEDKMPTNANAEEEKDMVHILGTEHGDDDVKAGKPLDYKGTPSAQNAEGDTKAGTPVDYKGIPSAREPVEAAPAGQPQGYVPGAKAKGAMQPRPADLWFNNNPSFGGGLVIDNSNGPPEKPLSHEDMVKQRVELEGLPSGMTRILQRKYILRPEAIESVWYMYRITGDQHWRKVGWQMFQAVDKATATEYGNSAIWDVTSVDSEATDSQESFWLAETLKYYYLLFSEEDVISLDEWVLNTEAHPFKRPTPKKKLY